MKTIDAAVLKRLFEPLMPTLTPEAARKLVKYRFDAKSQSRIDKLARKCNDGVFSDEKRREYETYVHSIEFISILQGKARALLKRSSVD